MPWPPLADINSRRPTPLVELHAIGRIHSAPHLFAKIEYATPSGNHKHRLAEIAVEQFQFGARAGITAASCGHLAASLASLCTDRRIPCLLFVPRGCPVPIRRSEWVSVSAEFESYEEAVRSAARVAASGQMLDATPGAELAEDYRDALASISTEILEQCDDPPALVICPVGNGTTLAGLHRGFAKSPSVGPRLYGVATPDNVFTGSAPSTNIGNWDFEPLHSIEPLDREAAESAVARSGGEWICASTSEIISAHRELSDLEGISVHPAAAAALAGWHALVIRQPRARSERSVLILTAQKRLPL